MAPSHQSQPLVLIVEDEPPVREMLTRTVAMWGYRVISVENAEHALTMMAAEVADILLCDIRLPGYDGLWLAEQVHARWPGTAIVMATGNREPQTVLQSYRLGAVDYIVKPFAQAVLRQAIDRASGRASFRPSVIDRSRPPRSR